MKSIIIKKAQSKFNKLAKKYNGFINVILDDWRGCRFIYDTANVRRCDNNCQNCSLFNLVKNEKPGQFSADLCPASARDKKLFGPQNFLNCKTLKQYGQCYVNFIKQIKNKKELVEELELVKNSKVIYCRDFDRVILEKEFKDNIFQQAIKQARGWKRRIIEKIGFDR